MMTRKEVRERSADYLNSLSRDELFERFLITRIAKIDGLDIIGVPVYSSCRPAGRVISVNAGKSQDPQMARAGAIAEAIEFHTFEFPEGEFSVEPFGEGLDLPLRADTTWTPETPIGIEMVTEYASGALVRFPSEMIWMLPRGKQENRFFIRSSNGQALGATFEDAFLQGLYEVVERDQVSIRRISMERLNVWPSRVCVPESLLDVAQKVTKASLKLYLFSCEYDIGIPSYMATLIDPYGGLGTFNGWGCHLSPTIAAERAILEAIQSRAVYISGARDDILRREFYNNQQMDPWMMISHIETLPINPFPVDPYEDMPPETELRIVLSRLEAWKSRIYYKDIDRGDFHLVKTVILGMEHPNLTILKGWRAVRWEKLVEREVEWNRTLMSM